MLSAAMHSFGGVMFGETRFSSEKRARFRVGRSFLNCRDEFHFGWAGYKVVLEGRLERLASKPPGLLRLLFGEGF